MAVRSSGWKRSLTSNTAPKYFANSREQNNAESQTRRRYPPQLATAVERWPLSGGSERMSELTEWDSFYVIVGSAAGALIGLQFVVMTLIADRPKPAAEAGAAFGTPTIVHFSIALLLSAVLRAPWQAITAPAVLWGLIGFIGVIYTAIVARRMKKQPVYRPCFEDWLFHAALPLQIGRAHV